MVAQRSRCQPYAQAEDSSKKTGGDQRGPRVVAVTRSCCCSSSCWRVPWLYAGRSAKAASPEARGLPENGELADSPKDGSGGAGKGWRWPCTTATHAAAPASAPTPETLARTEDGATVIHTRCPAVPAHSQ